MASGRRRREPFRSMAMNVAKRVYQELGLAHPTEADIETIAFARNVLVDQGHLVGVRAQLTCIENRAVITVSDSLAHEQKRFAVAHELGHFEVHPKQAYAVGCTGRDFVSDYRASGREGEANAFASEFLMPEALCAKRCDVEKVTWRAVEPIASEFQVSLTAAAMRFVELCPEAVALVCSHEGKIEWFFKGMDFWGRIEKGKKLDAWSLASDYFVKGTLSPNVETVSASSWLEGVSDELDMKEHSISLGSLGRVLSLLWLPVS